MSSTKSHDALDSLEADLRSRLDDEVRTLEAYRARLEREARIDAELARVDDAIARRIGSIPPPASPSYRPASYHPAALQSAPPPAFPSWNPPTSMLPPASVAPAPVSQALPYAYQTSRMVTLATISAMLAVVVSLTVLVISAGDRVVPTANAAERPMTTIVASAPAAPAAGASCSDKSDAKKTDEAKPTAAPEPVAVAVAKPLGPVSVVAPVAVAPASNVRRSASRSSVPSKPAAPSPAPEAAAPAAAPAAPAPVATNMDDAARTAQMLREQLGASLK